MENPAEILRDARGKLKINTEGLAGLLGVSLPTLRSWIAPTTSKMHRDMPKTAQLLLERILVECKQGSDKKCG